MIVDINMIKNFTVYTETPDSIPPFLIVNLERTMA